MTNPVFRWTLALGFAAAAMGLLLAHAARAQDAAGTWHGALAVGGRELRLVVKLSPSPGGSLTGQIASVDQGGGDIPLADVTRAGGTLTFTAPSIHARYEGRWDAQAHAWVGLWLQGASLPLTLSAGDLPPGPVVDGLDGTWTAALTTAVGGRIRLVLHVGTSRYGTIATLDSPDQLAFGLPLADLSRAAREVRFVVPSVGGAYVGSISPDGQKAEGAWSQGGRSTPLSFTRGAPEKVSLRPQTPKPPFPYREEEVTVASAPGVRLSGTLTLPQGKGRFPAAVLITGSGPQDRDETILGHKPFAVLADYLTRRGIAVLRLDDRGVGKSTGDFGKALTTDFAVDAEAAAQYLRSRPDIDPAKVGLIGHSEGGIVGPMVAANDRKIAFVVMMAGPGAPMSEVLAAQRLALAPGMGLSEKLVQDSNTGIAKAMEAMKTAKTREEAQAKAAAALKAAAPKAPPQLIEAQAQAISSDWFRALMAYDPRPTLRRLRTPVLAIGGSKDRQVPPEQNLPAIREALKGDPDATVVELPGLNHLFQTAPTGAVGEYADIEETIAPSALKTIGDWIEARVGR